MCEHWVFELALPPGSGTWGEGLDNAVMGELCGVAFRVQEPLFPGRRTRVAPSHYQCLIAKDVDFDTAVITATLCLGSSQPVVKKFLLNDLKADV
jgi:hypothetical protein